MLRTILKCAFRPITVGFRSIANGLSRQMPDAHAFMNRVRAFAENEGRQPRILVAIMDRGGNDSEIMQFATGFADFGFDVDLGPHVQTPEAVARQAADEDVHVIGVRNMVSNQLTVIRSLMKELEKLGRPDIPVILAGDVPFKDHETLYKAGVAAIFFAEAGIIEQASKTLDRIEAAFPPIKPRTVRTA